MGVAVFPLSTFPEGVEPLASSETFNVTTCSPRLASAATLPVTFTVASFPTVAPVFLTTGPPWRLTPLGNPLSAFRLTVPFSPLSETFKGTSNLAPLKTVTTGAFCSLSDKTDSLLLSVGFFNFTVGDTKSLGLTLTVNNFGVEFSVVQFFRGLLSLAFMVTVKPVEG